MSTSQVTALFIVTTPLMCVYRPSQETSKAVSGKPVLFIPEGIPHSLKSRTRILHNILLFFLDEHVAAPVVS